MLFIFNEREKNEENEWGLFLVFLFNNEPDPLKALLSLFLKLLI